MKQKRIMILIWNMGIGGIQKRVKDIIIELSTNLKYKHVQTHLVVKFEEPSFFTQELLERTNKSNVEISYFTSSYQKSKSYPAFLWVLKKYLEIKPTVLLTFLDHLSVLAVMMKYFAFWHDCKVVLNEGVLTSRYLKINRGHFWWIWMLMVSLFYRFADMIIVPSRAVKRDLIELFMIPNQKVTIIPNWTLFSKTNAHQSKKYDLAYIGRYEEEKDPMLFLEVVRLVHLQNSKLKACMVGSGKLEPQIKEFIRRHSLSKVVKLLSPLNNMSQVLPSCRLLLVTSKNEGLPNVVLEAGALEIPSIAAPFLGVEEVILEGETGWIRQEASEISSLVLTLLKNNKLITQTGHQAQQHIAKHFSHLNQKKFIQHLVT